MFIQGVSISPSIPRTKGLESYWHLSNLIFTLKGGLSEGDSSRGCKNKTNYVGYLTSNDSMLGSVAQVQGHLVYSIQASNLKL